MKTLIIDRFEGSYAICEDKDQKYFGIETAELQRCGHCQSEQISSGILQQDH